MFYVFTAITITVAICCNKGKGGNTSGDKGKARVTGDKGKTRVPLGDKGKTFKVKAVVELSSGSSSSLKRSSSSTASDWVFVSTPPTLEDQVAAFDDVDAQLKADNYHRKNKKADPVKKKKKKFRFLKVFVGVEDLTEKGYPVLMTGGLKFEFVYAKYLVR